MVSVLLDFAICFRHHSFPLCVAGAMAIISSVCVLHIVVVILFLQALHLRRKLHFVLLYIFGSGRTWLVAFDLWKGICTWYISCAVVCAANWVRIRS